MSSSWKPIMISYHSTYDIMLLDYIRPGYNLIIQGVVSDLSNKSPILAERNFSHFFSKSKRSINNNSFTIKLRKSYKYCDHSQCHTHINTNKT